MNTTTELVADIAAACGVPVEWVPSGFAALSDEEIVDRIEARRDAEKALRRSPLSAFFGARGGR